MEMLKRTVNNDNDNTTVSKSDVLKYALNNIVAFIIIRLMTKKKYIHIILYIIYFYLGIFSNFRHSTDTMK